MDSVFVAPDGTFWLGTSYRDTDNDANPPGGLVWALGLAWIGEKRRTRKLPT
jgi:hypothetical protein